MTNEEAIEYLNLDKAGHQISGQDNSTKLYWDWDNVIEALGKAVESLKEKSEAEKKQIPKKVSFGYELVIDGIDEESSNCEAVWRCPICHEVIDVTVNYHAPYCPYCGQAIDWSDSE